MCLVYGRLCVTIFREVGGVGTSVLSKGLNRVGGACYVSSRVATCICFSEIWTRERFARLYVMVHVRARACLCWMVGMFCLG